MRHVVRYIGVLLLTGMLVLGIGLRGLPAPCQNGHCGPGGCATSAHPCPPSCTCHFSHGADGDCCQTGGHSHGGHPDLAVADHCGHAHGAPVATHQAHGHHGHTGHPGAATAATSPHCAPVSPPAAGDSWPNLSLPPIQPPALLASGPALELATGSDPVPTALPALYPWSQPPPLRPPAA